MAVYGPQLLLTWVCSESLQDGQYRALALDDSELAVNGQEALGILQQDPEAGDHATLVVYGTSKYRAGGAVAAGKPLTCTTSGWLKEAGSGDHVVGRNWQNAVTSGSIGMGFFNFATPTYAYSSSFCW